MCVAWNSSKDFRYRGDGEDITVHASNVSSMELLQSFCKEPGMNRQKKTGKLPMIIKGR